MALESSPMRQQPNMAPDPSHARFDRHTQDGRRIWYDLKVIQEPERARACGSGPKCKMHQFWREDSAI